MATGESAAGRNRQWLLARRPSGMVSEADFELVARPVPEIGPGEVLGRIPEAFADLRRWVEAGRIAYRVDVQEGCENIPRTFLRLFTGANEGKQLLRL